MGLFSVFLIFLTPDMVGVAIWLKNS